MRGNSPGRGTSCRTNSSFQSLASALHPSSYATRNSGGSTLLPTGALLGTKQSLRRGSSMSGAAATAAVVRLISLRKSRRFMFALQNRKQPRSRHVDEQHIHLAGHAYVTALVIDQREPAFRAVCEADL